MHPAKPHNDIAYNFQELFNDSPLAIYTCDESGIITFFNQAAVELWGQAPEKGSNSWCGSWKAYYVDGRPMPLDECPMALTLKHKKSFGGREIVIERPDRTFRNLLVFPQPVFNSDAALTGAYNTLVDITDQKSGEQKQAILAAIVESSDDAIVSKNLDGIITSWNKGAQKIFGYSEAEIIGKSVTVLIPKELQSEEEMILHNIKSGNKVDHFQTVRVTKSGEKINVSITVSPLKDSRGNITGASKIARDITDSLRKEQAIKQNAQRLEILNSIAKEIAGNLDSEYILKRVTDATTKITGAVFGAFFYNITNENGEPVALHNFAEASKEAFEKSGLVRNTKVFREVFNDKRVVRTEEAGKDSHYGKNTPHKGMPEGHLTIVSYMAVPVVTPDGNVLGGLFFGHPEAGVFTAEHEDLVMNIATQASVALDNSRLFDEVKALNIKKDEFIALASHELKTPITTIKGYLQILQKNEPDTVGQLFLDKCLRQLNKLNSLISDLFDISKIEAGKLQLNYETFDIHKLLLDITETFVYSTTTHKIILNETNFNGVIEADKQRIEQVIINLLTNAIKYSPNAQEVFVTLSGNINGITVAVRDNGIGLSIDQQKKIFARFYRVDGNMNISGLGLGLYLSKEIIERHHGEISVKSEPGKGSEFSFFMPSQKRLKTPSVPQ